MRRLPGNCLILLALWQPDEQTGHPQRILELPPCAEEMVARPDRDPPSYPRTDPRPDRRLRPRALHLQPVLTSAGEGLFRQGAAAARNSVLKAFLSVLNLFR